MQNVKNIQLHKIFWWIQDNWTLAIICLELNINFYQNKFLIEMESSQLKVSKEKQRKDT